MDWHRIYETSRHRPLRPEERKALDEIVQKFPYFALPHTLQARVNPDTETTFVAATYATNRALLRQALQGEQPFAPLTESLKIPQDPPMSMEADISIPRPVWPTEPPQFWHAPFVAGIGGTSAGPVGPDTSGAFFIQATTPPVPPGYAWLQATVCSHTTRLLPQLQRVRQQLRSGPIQPASPPADPVDMFADLLDERARRGRPRPQPPAPEHRVARE
ncbi:MAG: hypothetical protein D6722_19170, partial [Bacteroidetes bacterium]